MPSFDTPEPINARITSPSGDITVETADNVTTTTVTLDGDDQIVADTRVEYRSGTLRVEAPRSNRWGRNGELDITVTLPDDSSVQVETASGDVSLHGTFNDVRVNSASGDVSLDDATGTVRIETASGDVEVRHAGGPTTITTASGDVSLENADGGDDVTVSTASGGADLGRISGDLRVRAASGDISVENAEGNVDANAASGDVSLDRVHRGRVGVQTANGDVSIDVTPGIPVWLDLHSLSGDVSTDQDHDGGPAEGEDTLELRVNTVSGDISVGRAH